MVTCGISQPPFSLQFFLFADLYVFFSLVAHENLYFCIHTYILSTFVSVSVFLSKFYPYLFESIFYLSSFPSYLYRFGEPIGLVFNITELGTKLFRFKSHPTKYCAPLGRLSDLYIPEFLHL